MKKEIESICKEESHKESCGFILMSGDKFEIVKCNNVSTHPESSFEISYKDLTKYLMNQKMVAIFHSHINTDEKFSEKDVKISEELMFPFWVYSSKTKKHNVYIPKNLHNKKNIKNFCKKVRAYKCNI